MFLRHVFAVHSRLEGGDVRLSLPSEFRQLVLQLRIFLRGANPGEAETILTTGREAVRETVPLSKGPGILTRTN
jgi:hypothetical protein